MQFLATVRVDAEIQIQYALACDERGLHVRTEHDLEARKDEF